MTATSPIGSSTSGMLPDEGTPAGAELRGQIFRTGVSLALALAFLIGGFALAFGVEDLTAVLMAMISFAVIVVISFFAEVIIEPSLERIAQQREEERKEREKEMMPSAGGVMGTAATLTGGAAAAPRALPPGASGGVAGRAGAAAAGLKGRALDITLPEETVSPAPAARSGVVGAPPPRTASAPAAASSSPAAPPPAAPSSAGAPAAGAPAAGAPAAPAGGEAADEGFQDLASLLREASQPSPVPARPRQ